ncbi:unnamed protein product [Gadus morhua 'NCC']
MEEVTLHSGAVVPHRQPGVGAHLTNVDYRRRLGDVSIRRVMTGACRGHAQAQCGAHRTDTHHHHVRILVGTLHPETDIVVLHRGLDVPARHRFGVRRRRLGPDIAPVDLMGMDPGVRTAGGLRAGWTVHLPHVIVGISIT